MQDILRAYSIIPADIKYHNTSPSQNHNMDIQSKLQQQL